MSEQVNNSMIESPWSIHLFICWFHSSNKHRMHRAMWFPGVLMPWVEVDDSNLGKLESYQSTRSKTELVWNINVYAHSSFRIWDWLLNFWDSNEHFPVDSCCLCLPSPIVLDTGFAAGLLFVSWILSNRTWMSKVSLIYGRFDAFPDPCMSCRANG